MEDEIENLRDPDSKVPALINPEVPPGRRRRRYIGFVPPLLIVITALGLLRYRSTHPDWQGLTGLFKSRPKAAVISGDRPIEAIKPPVAPIVVKTEPSQPPTVAITSIPSPTVEPPSHSEPTRPEATPGLPVALAPVPPSSFDPVPPSTTADPVPPKLEPVPMAPPDPAIAEMNAQVEKARRSQAAKDAIEQEAQRVKLNREGMEALKPTVAANEANEEEIRKIESLKRAYQDADSDRVRLLDELRSAIARLGSRAGPTVRELVERHRLDPHPVVLGAVKEARKKSAGRIERSQSIEIHRALGLPEALIVEDLAAAEWKNHVARNGPRTQEEAFVRAARQVLAVPLLPSSRRVPVPVLRRDEAASR